jgi:hypothetical protein
MTKDYAKPSSTRKVAASKRKKKNAKRCLKIDTPTYDQYQQT